MDKTISLQHVQNALMCAVVRQKVWSGQRAMARMAAFTCNPTIGPDCRHPWRDAPPPLQLAYMTHGNLLRLVQRTHLQHGAAQVRRTWGLGLRALQCELRDGLMR